MVIAVVRYLSNWSEMNVNIPAYDAILGYSYLYLLKAGVILVKSGVIRFDYWGRHRRIWRNLDKY